MVGGEAVPSVEGQDVKGVVPETRNDERVNQ